MRFQKKLHEEEKGSSVDEMHNKGIKINNACYYSGINRITYYYRKKHENNEDRRYITRIDSSIISKIIELCRERVTYGYNRIWALLMNSGIRIAKKTVYRIMKNNNLTLPLHSHKNRKELKLLRADKPEMLIERDITYIPTNNGMTYLMCIKDPFHDYNNIRPHSTLDYYSPLQFLDKRKIEGNFGII